MNPWWLADNPWLYFFFLALPMVVIVMIIFSFRRMMRNRRAHSFLFFELLIAGTVVFDTIIGEVTFAYETADSILFLASRRSLEAYPKSGVTANVDNFFVLR